MKEEKMWLLLIIASVFLIGAAILLYLVDSQINPSASPRKPKIVWKDGR
jgi:hypothetical protein